jgi:hypothetical protein
MIEKKIKYDINIEKPSKTKPVKQGGVFNYLGKQKTVNAPVRWRSSKDHPIAHLSYITKDEEKILIDLNLYGSLKGKPNRGPFGLPSLQGSGGGSGGDGGDGGSSGGDSGGDSGDGEGSSSGSGGGVGGDDGAAASAAGDAGVGTGDSAGVGGSGDSTSGEGAGSGPGGEAGTGGVSASTSSTGIGETANTIANTLTGFAKNAIANAVNNPVATAVGVVAGPVAGMVANAIGKAVDAANRGVTGPSDDTQESTSVQSGPSQSPSDGGGIGTIQAYAPIYNPDTGNPTMDAYMRRLRVNLGLPV